MTIADEITREVVFTDYECANDARIEVVVTVAASGPLCNIRMPLYPMANFIGANDIFEPDLLRSYAHCLLKAADEMERISQ